MRRKGRECALQILFQLDLSGSLYRAVRDRGFRAQVVAEFWENFEAVGDEARSFAERLVDGVLEGLEDVDNSLAKCAQNWRLERMASVDRNIMRVSAYEIGWCPDIPRSASISEALEIAKKFSGQESAAFINGVIDQLPDLAE